MEERDREHIILGLTIIHSKDKERYKERERETEREIRRERERE